MDKKEDAASFWKRSFIRSVMVAQRNLSPFGRVAHEVHPIATLQMASVTVQSKCGTALALALHDSRVVAHELLPIATSNGVSHSAEQMWHSFSFSAV